MIPLASAAPSPVIVISDWWNYRVTSLHKRRASSIVTWHVFCPYEQKPFKGPGVAAQDAPSHAHVACRPILRVHEHGVAVQAALHLCGGEQQVGHWHVPPQVRSSKGPLQPRAAPPHNRRAAAVAHLGNIAAQRIMQPSDMPNQQLLARASRTAAAGQDGSNPPAQVCAPCAYLQRLHWLQGQVI